MNGYTALVLAAIGVLSLDLSPRDSLILGMSIGWLLF